VSGPQELDAALHMSGPHSGQSLATSSVPRSRGPVGGREPAPQLEDGRAPPPQPPTPPWKEVNRMQRPSLEELQRQLEEDGGCEAVDGCWVEPDGSCEHGQPSWLVVLGLI
jgi:hypothetical protein